MRSPYSDQELQQRISQELTEPPYVIASTGAWVENEECEDTALEVVKQWIEDQAPNEYERPGGYEKLEEDLTNFIRSEFLSPDDYRSASGVR